MEASLGDLFFGHEPFFPVTVLLVTEKNRLMSDPIIIKSQNEDMIFTVTAEGTATGLIFTNLNGSYRRRLLDPLKLNFDFGPNVYVHAGKITIE